MRKSRNFSILWLFIWQFEQPVTRDGAATDGGGALALVHQGAREYGRFEAPPEKAPTKNP